MVKPLNKEWELFGRKYRVAGAKGDKVDCNACQKQVSAAVNRLQSHLRVCPARPTLPVALASLDDAAQQAQDMQQVDQDAAVAGSGELEDASNAGNGMHVGHADSIGDASELADSSLDHNVANAAMLPAAPTATLVGGVGATSSADAGSAAGAMHDAPASIAASAGSGVPAAKRQKSSPLSRSKDHRPRWSNSAASSSTAGIAAMDDFWLTGTPQPPSSSAYAKRRLELEEKRLLLEMKKDQREERRELFHLEILEAQARKERLVAEKEAYETKVLLALSRKQLRDQGVSEDEIDRILPVENAAKSSYSTTASDGEC